MLARPPPRARTEFLKTMLPFSTVFPFSLWRNHLVSPLPATAEPAPTGRHPAPAPAPRLLSSFGCTRTHPPLGPLALSCSEGPFPRRPAPAPCLSLRCCLARQQRAPLLQNESGAGVSRCSSGLPAAAAAYLPVQLGLAASLSHLRRRERRQVPFTTRH